MVRSAPIVALAFVVAACTTIRPDPRLAVDTADTFSHDAFDRVLREHVDSQGLVDYGGLVDDPADLDLYYRQIASISPDNRPDRFGNDTERLTYWLNAYNASVMKAVIEAYPISEVGDVGFPFWKIGFFVQQKIVLGGESMSLYHLENAVVRDRFRDPRIHFALNCASASCPRLPDRAFQPAMLEQRLEEETHRFINETRNVRVDHAERILHLSSIFDWYETDFTVWPAQELPPSPTLIDYIRLYADTELKEDLARAREYEVRFNPYDWSLNDRARSPQQ